MRRLGFDIAVTMAALLLAVMAIFAAVGFACLSLYLYLAPLAGPPLAALATAFAALLFALAVAGIASLKRRRRRPRAGTSEFSGLADALGLGQTLGTEGRDFLATHLSKASMALFGLGVAMGLSPKLRKLIADLLLR